MRAERGFMLLEVLIAAAIATLGLAVLLRTALDGITTVRAAGAYEMAIVLARSHLALLGRDVSGMPEDTEGHDGPFTWQLHVTPHLVAGPADGTTGRALYQDEDRAALFTVALDIAWNSGGTHRVVHVETQRLGFVPPPPS